MAHPRDHQVYIPPEEELHYFVEDINWKQGIDWYRARFADAGDVMRSARSRRPNDTPRTPWSPRAHRRVAA